MKRKISPLTITLIIILILLMIKFVLINKTLNDLSQTCSVMQDNLGNFETFYTEAVAGWVSCISSEDDLKIKRTLFSYVILIVVFLILLSWKIDKLVKKK